MLQSFRKKKNFCFCNHFISWNHTKGHMSQPQHLQYLQLETLTNVYQKLIIPAPVAFDINTGVEFGFSTSFDILNNCEKIQLGSLCKTPLLTVLRMPEWRTADVKKNIWNLVKLNSKYSSKFLKPDRLFMTDLTGKIFSPEIQNVSLVSKWDFVLKYLATSCHLTKNMLTD